MTDPTASDRTDFLLVAALYFAKPPTDNGRTVASCHHVLKHAMIAAGVWEEVMTDAFHGDDEAYARFPLVPIWYRSLIALTQVKPEAKRLMEGAGNLDLPAGAFFTECWLTEEGQRAAIDLIRQTPDRFAGLSTPCSL